MSEELLKAAVHRPAVNTALTDVSSELFNRWPLFKCMNLKGNIFSDMHPSPASPTVISDYGSNYVQSDPNASHQCPPHFPPLPGLFPIRPTDEAERECSSLSLTTRIDMAIIWAPAKLVPRLADAPVALVSSLFNNLCPPHPDHNTNLFTASDFV